LEADRCEGEVKMCSPSAYDKYATLHFDEMRRTEIKYSYFDEELGIRSTPDFRDKIAACAHG